MKILFLANWKVNFMDFDDETFQPPDKYIRGRPYWFFRYWPDPTAEVKIIDISNLPIISTLERNVFKFYTIQALKGFLSSRSFDLIIAHGAQSAVVLGMIRSLTGSSMPPFFIIDAGCFNGGRDRKYETIPINFASRSVNGIIYHAKVQSEYYRRNLDFIANDAIFIPFGADDVYFSPLNGNLTDTIISFGNKKRDYQTLLEAWRKVRTAGTKLYIVGMKDRFFRKHTNLPANVEIMSWLKISELKKLIGAAKFVVLPLPFFKYSYGQMSLLQSMSMAKAVVVTRTPGVIDYVVDNENGFFVNPYDVNDLSNKIAQLLNNPRLSSSVGHNARITVTADFNEKIMARRIYNFILKTMARKKSLTTFNHAG